MQLTNTLSVSEHLWYEYFLLNIMDLTLEKHHELVIIFLGTERAIRDDCYIDGYCWCISIHRLALGRCTNRDRRTEVPVPECTCYRTVMV